MNTLLCILIEENYREETKILELLYFSVFRLINQEEIG